MSDPVLELAGRGRSLAPQERERLVELLLTTLVDPATREIDASWNQEIESRVAAHEAGALAVHELEDVLSEARRIAP